jgi:hypothetical protein
MTFLDPFDGRGWMQAPRLDVRVNGSVVVVRRAVISRQRPSWRAQMRMEFNRPALSSNLKYR